MPCRPLAHFRRACATVLVLAAAVASAQALSQTPATEQRLALLIGNAAYRSSPLANPDNDVRLMEAALKDAGFQILKFENAGRRDMQRLIRDFGERLKQSGGVGLFYFAGHGVQVRGNNYLIPVDADIRAEDEVAFDSIDAQSVLEKMESAGNRVNLLILDACRDNPFTRRSRTAAAGLATMSAPSGSLVAYATAPGAIASDGAGSNGLYTQHLARILRDPGLPVEEVFKQVRTAVRRDSKGHQTPWENTALEGQFFFKPLVGTAAPAASPDTSGLATTHPFQLELALWDRVKAGTSPEEIQVYLSRYPQGVFTELAKSKLAALQPQPSTPARLPEAASGTLQRAAMGGVLATRDRYGRDTLVPVVQVRVDRLSSEWSTGDEVSADGQVLAVRIGERVFMPRTGSLWRLPLKEGARGDAVVKLSGVEPAGQLSWQVVKVDGGDLAIEAIVDYDVPPPQGATQRPNPHRGLWVALYKEGIPLPVSFTTNIRAPLTDYLDKTAGELRNFGGN